MRYFVISIKCGHCLIGDFTVTCPEEELAKRGAQLPLHCTCGAKLQLTFIGVRKP